MDEKLKNRIIAAVTMTDYVALAKDFPLNISAEANGKTADVRINGVIYGWQNSAEEFREKIEQFKTDGVKTINLYMNTPGGSVFEANEIKNVLDGFDGEIKGFGGALVASAGTYIRLACSTFEIASNGQFMIHKPKGMISGNENEVENHLKLLKSFTDQYRTAYAELTGLSEEEIESLWAKGDYWMNAKTALKEGFITSVAKAKAKITEKETAMFTACAASHIPKPNEKSKPETEMDVKATALALGLPEDATEAQVRAEMAKLKAKAEKADQLEIEAKTKAETDRKAEIKAILDKGIADKKIVANQTATLEKFANADFDGFKAHMESLQAIGKISEQINGNSGKAAAAASKDKKFADMTEDEKTALAEEDPDAFTAKYEDYLNQ